MNAHSSYMVKKWEENSYAQISPNSKLTKASVEYQVTGEIDGKALVEYLMFYRHFDPNDQHKSSASYIGLIRFDGKLKDKSGTFVLQDHGTFDAGGASSVLQIIAGSGTGALRGIIGTGKYLANKEGYFLDLDYDLPQ